MHARSAGGAWVAPGGGIFELHDTAVHPGVGQNAQARLRLWLIAKVAQLRDGALYRGAERLIQHAAELHQRRTQLWVVAGGELCEESRRENNRERFVAAESECGEEAAL